MEGDQEEGGGFWKEFRRKGVAGKEIRRKRVVRKDIRRKRVVGKEIRGKGWGYDNALKYTRCFNQSGMGGGDETNRLAP